MTGRPPENPTQTVVQKIVKVAEEEVGGRNKGVLCVSLLGRRSEIFTVQACLVYRAPSGRFLLRTCPVVRACWLNDAATILFAE